MLRVPALSCPALRRDWRETSWCSGGLSRAQTASCSTTPPAKGSRKTPSRWATMRGWSSRCVQASKHLSMYLSAAGIDQSVDPPSALFCFAGWFSHGVKRASLSLSPPSLPSLFRPACMYVQYFVCMYCCIDIDSDIAIRRVSSALPAPTKPLLLWSTSRPASYVLLCPSLCVYVCQETRHINIVIFSAFFLC